MSAHIATPDSRTYGLHPGYIVAPSNINLIESAPNLTTPALHIQASHQILATPSRHPLKEPDHESPHRSLLHCQHHLQRQRR